MKSSWWRRAGGAIVLAGTAASGQTRPVIAVKFVLQENLYRNEYSTQDVSKIERGVADTLAQLLSRRIGFVQFERAGAAPQTLVVTLNRKDLGSGAQRHETGFYVRLATAGVAGQDTYWRMFRPLEEYLAARGTSAAFMREVQARFEVDDVESIQDLLRSIPISTQATLWQDAVVGIGWILPFRRADLCMDFETTLRIANTIRSGIDTRKEFRAKATGDFNTTDTSSALGTLRGNVVGMATDPTADLAILRTTPANAIIVNGVFIDHYHRSDAACAMPAAPQSTSFPGSPTGGPP
jgi:hypothetical protein